MLILLRSKCEIMFPSGNKNNITFSKFFNENLYTEGYF